VITHLSALEKCSDLTLPANPPDPPVHPDVQFPTNYSAQSRKTKENLGNIQQYQILKKVSE